MIRVFLKWLGIGTIVAIVSLMLAYAIIDAYSHDRINKRILAALASHYAPATVDVVERKDWYNGYGNTDFDFGGQICFGIEVQEPSGQRTRKVAMVVVGEAGGGFRFIREYPSLKRCANEFHRG